MKRNNTLIDLLDSDDEDASSSSHSNSDDALDPIQRRLYHLQLLLNNFNPREPLDRFSPDALRYLEEPTRQGMIKAMSRQLPSSSSSRTEVGAPQRLSPDDLGLLADFIQIKAMAVDAADSHPVLEVNAKIFGGTVVYPASFVRLLDPEVWIDEVVIQAFGLLLTRRFLRTNVSVAVLSPYYWTASDPRAMLQRLFAVEHRPVWKRLRYLFCPILFDGNHWTLLVIDAKLEQAYFLDSFHRTWEERLQRAHSVRIAANVDALWKELHVIHPTHGFLSKPSTESVRNRDPGDYPTQYDSSTCGLYVIHAMECIATALHVKEFQRPSWDAQRLLLRFHVALCLLDASVRRLQTAQPLIDLSFGSAVCVACGAANPVFHCAAWNKQRFCNIQCQERFADEHQLSYFGWA